MDADELKARADELTAKDWTIEVTRGEDGYFASVAELPGCMTGAETWNELEDMVREVIALWLEDALEAGEPIPQPRAGRAYSGRFVVRTSPSLHRAIARQAAEEGVSMNQWIVERLAAAARVETRAS